MIILTLHIRIIFHGRGFAVKKSAEELLRDIKDNYIAAITDADVVRQKGRGLFTFETNMENILKQIDEMENVNYKELTQNNSRMCRASQLPFFFMNSVREVIVQKYESDIKEYKDWILKLEKDIVELKEYNSKLEERLVKNGQNSNKHRNNFMQKIIKKVFRIY